MLGENYIRTFTDWQLMIRASCIVPVIPVSDTLVNFYAIFVIFIVIWLALCPVSLYESITTNFLLVIRDDHRDKTKTYNFLASDI